MHISESQLVSFLRDSGLVTEDDIKEAQKESKKKGADVGKTLVLAGKISDDDYRRIQALVLGVPYVDLKNQKIDLSVLSLIPEPVARTHSIVAFARKGDALEVAMLDINDLSAIDFVKKKVGLRILARLTDSASLKSVLLQYQKSLKAEFGDIIQQEAGSIKAIAETNGVEGGSADDLKKMAEDLPVVR